MASNSCLTTISRVKHFLQRFLPMISPKLRLLDLAEHLVSRGEAAAALAENPHRDGEKADEDVQATDNRKDF